MSIQYYEDVELYQKYRSREYHLKEKEIIDYAKQWDPQPQHIDPEQAKNTPFGGLVASSGHLISICIKLVNEIEPKLALVSGNGWDKTRFISPARSGDVLIYENEMISKRESKSNPNIGVLTFAGKLINQRGEVVYTSEGVGLIAKRPAKGNP